VWGVLTSVAAVKGIAVRCVTAQRSALLRSQLIYLSLCSRTRRCHCGASTHYSATSRHHFASECLRSRELLHPAQLENLRLLKTFLQVRAGEFLQHRPGEIAHILREQLRIVLSDAALDAKEDVYLVSLQSVFGLGYDSFLSHTRHRPCHAATG